MSKYLELLQTLNSLEAQRTRIYCEGDVLLNCWVAQSKPGGTARTDNAHWQLRSHHPVFDGKKSKYLRANEVGVYKSAIARGQAIKQLDRQIAVLQERLKRLEVLIGAG